MVCQIGKFVNPGAGSGSAAGRNSLIVDRLPEEMRIGHLRITGVAGPDFRRAVRGNVLKSPVEPEVLFGIGADISLGDVHQLLDHFPVVGVFTERFAQFRGVRGDPAVGVADTGAVDDDRRNSFRVAEPLQNRGCGAAGDRDAEEVDEDANIIFGSSFDASLDGKIRVSIVATGIDDNAPSRSEMLRKAEQIKEQPREDKSETAAVESMNEIARQMSQETVAEEAADEDEDIEEIVETATVTMMPREMAPAEETAFEDFDNLTKSEVLDDMPNSSALFKAIINKPADEAPEENVDASEQQIHEAIDAQENYFVPKAALKMPEEEPELFPNHNPAPTVAKPAEEMEELIVSESEPRRRSFIEIMTGRSIAKRNQQKQAARVQEPVAPSFADAGDDKVNLEIPSFLRRR